MADGAHATPAVVGFGAAAPRYDSRGCVYLGAVTAAAHLSPSLRS
ncbi:MULTISPECIES: hypothetical protein [unclassified Streptomyces]|nr:hypothetical protein [Streptomyces sp. CB02959]